MQAELAARRLARLVELDAEIRLIGRQIAAQVRAIGTGLLALPGIGPITAAQLIGEVRHPRRFATSISSPAPTAPPRSRPARWMNEEDGP